MRTLLLIWVLFLFTISSTFWYVPTGEDDNLLSNAYEKLDTIYESSPKTLEKLYKRIDEIKTSVKDNERVIYLLQELQDYSYEKLSSDTENQYFVSEVVDGDTVKVEYLGRESSIRLIGIDAPESYALRYGYVECYGQEVKTYLKNLIEWKMITLEYDASQGYKDDYKRSLAYIVYNWENINHKLIQDWYAWEFTYDEPYIYQEQFQNSEIQANTNLLWLWNNSTCNWERIDMSAQDKPKTTDHSELMPDTNSYDQEKNNQAIQREYIRGPKLWCYYRNKFDNKVYVDRELCNGLEY